MSQRKTGTIFWLSVILDHDELDAVDKLLLIGLADHIDAQDRAWPGMDTLARRAGKSYATAKRRLAALNERGFLERTRRHRRDGSLGTYEYQLVRERFGLDPLPSTGHQPAEVQGSRCALGDSPRAQNEPWPRAHLDAPAEVPSSEPEEEEEEICSDDPPTPDERRAALDQLVDDVALELLRRRDADNPGNPVPQRRGWLAKARKNLRQDDLVSRAAIVTRHPAAGCAGRPDAEERTVSTLAHLHRTGDWPTVSGPRRPVTIADADQPSSPTDVDAEDRTPMPDSVRAALPGARQ